MKLSTLAFATAVSLMAFGTAQAATTTINFESSPSGDVAEGFTAPGFSNLKFYSDLGSGLEVGNFGSQGDGQSMLVRNDSNGNFLRGVFTDGAHQFLSLNFGNDDPSFSNPGDRARLALYLGASLVGQVDVLLNRNDVMDQAIGWSFGAFDNFTFAYVNAAGSPFTGGVGTNVGLIEVVDNITFDTTAAIPEPATWGMLGMGLASLGMMARRRA